jgi:hypothetical protein
MMPHTTPPRRLRPARAGFVAQAHRLSEQTAEAVRMINRDYWILLHSEQIGLTGGRMESRVTLRPGEKGTKKLVQEHGHRLVCVRYRYDAAARMRYKTVELIVEQVPWDPGARTADPERRPRRPPSLVGVRVAWDDRALQQRIKDAGGRWVRSLRLWVLPLTAAKRLDLTDRLVPVPDRIEGVAEAYHGESSEKPHGELRGMNTRGTEGLS